MQILKESEGVFTIDTGDGQQTWVAHPGLELIMKLRMQKMESFDREQISRFGFKLMEECTCDLDIGEPEGVSPDFIDGIDIGYKLGFLDCFGYNLEDLLSGGVDLDELFQATWNDVYGNEETEFTGEETDEELDAKVCQYFERHGISIDTKQALFDSIDSISLRNRLKLRYNQNNI